MCEDFDLMDALPCSDKETDEPAEQEQPSVSERKIHREFLKVSNVLMMLYKMKVKPCCPEYVLEERLDEPSCDQCGATTLCANLAGTFTRCGKKEECSLFDCNQKILVRKDSQALQLQATHLKENMDYKKVIFNMEKYVNPHARGREAVILWIAGSCNILSSTLPHGSNTPILKLEKENCEQLGSIEAKGEKARFLFYRRTVDFNDTTYESVKFPGWLIRSSSLEENQVDLCQKETSTLSRFKETP